MHGIHILYHVLKHRRFNAERLGWLSLLANWWERRIDVVNRGFSGYNTRWLMPLVDRLFVPGGASPTKLVTIFLGANDCTLAGGPQHGTYGDRVTRSLSEILLVSAI